VCRDCKRINGSPTGSLRNAHFVAVSLCSSKPSPEVLCSRGGPDRRSSAIVAQQALARSHRPFQRRLFTLGGYTFRKDTMRVLVLFALALGIANLGFAVPIPVGRSSRQPIDALIAHARASSAVCPKNSASPAPAAAFPCSPYPHTPATSIHKLTPFDIGVVAAMGDSITAAFVAAFEPERLLDIHMRVCDIFEASFQSCSKGFRPFNFRCQRSAASSRRLAVQSSSLRLRRWLSVQLRCF
jgi:hypothetical protein